MLIVIRWIIFNINTQIIYVYPISKNRGVIFRKNIFFGFNVVLNKTNLNYSFTYKKYRVWLIFNIKYLLIFLNDNI